MIKHARIAIIEAVLMSFICSSVQAPAFAQIDPMPWMPKPGTMVHLSPQYMPAYLKGIVIHPKDPFKFDFIIYKGDEPLTYAQKKEEYTKLTKYFLASLAIPDEDQWVNLSPYEKDRIIKDNFGKTEMGRDLLAQDYLLKQITASLIYPESKLGKEFWKKVYDQAQKQYGTTNIPVNTFNKVWIVPDKAVIYEKGPMAYILESHLKVMLEEDYLSLKKHSGISSVFSVGKNTTHELASQIIRSIVLTELEKEVNTGKNFALLRQAYSGMILAAWYKQTLKESLLGKVYADQGKVKGIEQPDRKANAAIYRRYVETFKKGVFNYIKEYVDPQTKLTVARKYFSGGMVGMANFAMMATFVHHLDTHQALMFDKAMSQADDVKVNLITNDAMGHSKGFSRRNFLKAAIGAAAAIPAAPLKAQINPSGLFKSVSGARFAQLYNLSTPVANVVVGPSFNTLPSLYPNTNGLYPALPNMPDYLRSIFNNTFYLQNEAGLNALGVFTIRQAEYRDPKSRLYRDAQAGEMKIELFGREILNSFMLNTVSPYLKTGKDENGNHFLILPVPQAGDRQGIIFENNQVFLTNGLVDNVKQYYLGLMMARVDIITQTERVNAQMRADGLGSFALTPGTGLYQLVVNDANTSNPFDDVLGFTYSAQTKHLIIINLNNGLPQANVINFNIPQGWQEQYFTTGAVGELVNSADLMVMGFDLMFMMKVHPENNGYAQSFLPANRTLYRILPSDTDPKIQRFNTPHWVFYNSPMEPAVAQKLFLFLPGTDPNATSPFPNLQYIFNTMALAGSPVIALQYDNLNSVGQICSGKGAEAAGEVRAKRAFGRNKPGEKYADLIDDTPNESIENRLQKLLVFLNKERPNEGWNRYLHKDGSVKWDSIVIMGHSQGSGMAAFIAKRRKTAGVLLLSGPVDHYNGFVPDTLSPWITDPGNQTPSELWYAMHHAQERHSNLLQEAEDALGVPKAHQTILELRPRELDGDNPYHPYTSDLRTNLGPDGWGYFYTFFPVFSALANVDHAQLITTHGRFNRGGIDLNSANLDLYIKRDGNGMPLPLAQQDLTQLADIQGLDPVILSIKPASQTVLFSQLIGNP